MYKTDNRPLETVVTVAVIQPILTVEFAEKPIAEKRPRSWMPLVLFFCAVLPSLAYVLVLFSGPLYGLLSDLLSRLSCLRLCPGPTHRRPNCPDCEPSRTGTESNNAHEPMPSWDLQTRDTQKGIQIPKNCGLFDRLPPELLNQVMDLSSPLTLRCLKTTCRTLYHYPYTTVGLADLSTAGWFELHCRLERDQSSLERVICGHCRTDHPAAWFPSPELQKLPYQRRCMNTKPAFRICAHITQAFEDIEWKAHHRLGKPLCEGDFCGMPTLKCVAGNFHLKSRYCIAIVSGGDWPHISEVTNLLDMYNIPICPHLSLGHSPILQAYDTFAREFRCQGCNTHVKFRFGRCSEKAPVVKFLSCLEVSVSRNLGNLTCAADQQWLAQLCVTKEPELGLYWLSCKSALLRYKADVLDRICTNTACGDEGCYLKRRLRKAESDIRKEVGRVKYEMDSKFHGMGLRRSFKKFVDPTSGVGNVKDVILYKPLWICPGTALAPLPEGYGPDGFLLCDEL